MKIFGSYATYYDLLYKDKNYAAETAFVISHLDRFAPGASNILELGCGTGIHALLLAEAGYRVDAVDLSDEMLACAKKRAATSGHEVAAKLSFRRGDMRNFSMGETYHAAIALFHVMSYQVEDHDLAAAIATVRQHLTPGMPFVFDFWHGPAVVASEPTARVKTAENDAFRVTRRGTPAWDRDRNLVQVKYHITVLDKRSKTTEEFQENHAVRYFFVPDLIRRLENGGFRSAICGEWLTNHTPTEGSFSAYIVAIAD